MRSPIQAQNMDMSGWQKVPQSPPPQRPQPTVSDPEKRSPFMLASMPLMASTGDAFSRQFYGGTNVPTYRILPVAIGGKSQ